MTLKWREMAWLIDLVTLITVLVGLTFAGLELRQVREAQESQVVLQFFETMRSEEYIEASLLIQALPEGLSAQQIRERLTEEELRRILQLRLAYEALGLMVYRGDVSIEWVDELFRFGLVQSWKKLAALTMDYRKQSGYLGVNEWHQWLAERLLEIDSDQPLPAYEAYSDWQP